MALASSLFGGAKAPLPLLISLALPRTDGNELKESELIEYITSKPTSKYARRLWFFYEFLIDRELPIEDLKQGNYIDLLEEERYYFVGKKFPTKIKFYAVVSA